ncbi:trna 5-methylaminomethyl-2-thiouridylate -methyltransferase [Holotrichia oblita]|nr:trna 5-methylaminomethyl-2-thiouridylate -methyltransferase [Holotrichia oblita]
MNSSAKNKRVIIGMSGGVDSSVAAHLLLRDGYEVIGAYMHNWEEKGFADNCTDEEDYKDVKEVAACLEIPIYTANFAKEYLDNVFNYFLDEYSKGRTPNPDVLCNREIKFGSFMKYAKALGADYVATGHYCGIKHENNASYLESQERWFVVEKDLKTNTLVVSHGEESVLNSKALYASNINWIPYPPKEKEFECYAKFRYRQPEQRVKVKIDGNNAFVEFFTQQRAITPGQFAVFYNGEYCLGGGTIDEAFK